MEGHLPCFLYPETGSSVLLSLLIKKPSLECGPPRRAAAFSRIAGQLAGRTQDRVLGKVRLRASSLEESGSKLPHSKTRRFRVRAVLLRQKIR